MTASGEPAQPNTVPEMRASRLLAVRAVWITPVVIAAVLIFLMTLIYVGSVVDPASHLRGLPVLLVNEDVGGTVQSQHVDIGQQLVSDLDRSPAVNSRLSLHRTTMEQAIRQMNKNAAYVAIVVPAGFTTSTIAVFSDATPGAQTSGLPTVQILMNSRAGSIGVSLATAVAEPALAAISKGLGQELTTQSKLGANANPALRAVRANPITVATVPYRPLPAHSALGLSAFYVSLLTILCGFLGATLVNSTVDAALGYATNEIGPKFTQRMPLRITRWQTLLSKWVMAVVIMPILTGLLLIVAIGVLHMDAPHVVLLWIFAAFAAAVVAIGTLVFFAVFGSLGQLLAMLVFVYLALASSGGTIPLQALPGILKFAGGFEPLRQVLGGVRSILYYNAAGDAGLTRGFTMAGVGLAIWVVLGVAVTAWYDRQGLYRMRPELLEYVQRSIRAYPDRGLPHEPGQGTPEQGTTEQGEGTAHGGDAALDNQ